MMEHVIIFTIVMAFLITVLLSPIFIPFLRRLNLVKVFVKKDQNHIMKKSGTPTMGGILIILISDRYNIVMIGEIFHNHRLKYIYFC